MNILQNIALLIAALIATLISVMILLAPVWTWLHISAIRKTLDEMCRLLKDKASVDVKAEQYVCDKLLEISEKLK